MNGQTFDWVTKFRRIIKHADRKEKRSSSQALKEVGVTNENNTGKALIDALISATTESAAIEPGRDKVRSLLEEAQKKLNADAARFRLRSWDDRSVVNYVPQWTIGHELENVEAELAERIYYDPEEPLRIDCMVGLVARIARIKEEEMKEVKNDELLVGLKAGIKARAESLGTHFNSQREDEELKKFMDDIGIYFDHLQQEKEFNDFITRLKGEIKNLQHKKENWKKYLDDLKKIHDSDDFFGEAFKKKSRPWKKGEKVENKQIQWEQLRDYLKEWKRGSEIEEFVKAVERTVERYSLLHAQYTRYLEHTKSQNYEIAVPVIAFGKFIGVLNFHKRSEFSSEDVKLARVYASLLATAHLQWQTELFEEFQKITQVITSESNFKIIASKITQGIRKSLGYRLKEHNSIERHNVFPILYVPKRPIDKSEKFVSESEKETWKEIWKDSYQQRSEPEGDEGIALWETERKLGPIPIRVNGLGGTIISNWAEKMESGRFLEAKDHFIVCLDVDDPNSTCGSRSALYHNIRSTGCLPLTFMDKVYGLLYLHWEVRHFFTEVELSALNAFGTQAAIAIKNAKLTGDSYERLYGSKLPELLMQSTRMNWFGNVGKILGTWGEQVRHTRGSAIADVTIGTIEELSKYFELPEGFTTFIGEFRRREGALQPIIDYREHFVHSFHVFCLGYAILCQWKAKGKGLGLLKSLRTDEDDVLKTWFIASIYHDVGVPAGKFEIFVKEFFRIYVGRGIRSQMDWGPVLLVDENLEHIKEISKLFAEKVEGKAQEFEKWFLKILLENHDHGALSALILLSKEEKWAEKGQWDTAKEAALAIALHNWKRDPDKSRNFDLGSLAVENFPLAFFLGYCDTAQEWGRKVMLELMTEGDTQGTLSFMSQPDSILEEVEVKDDKTVVTIYSTGATETKEERALEKGILEDIFRRVGIEFSSKWYLKEKETEKLLIKGKLFSTNSFGASELENKD